MMPNRNLIGSIVLVYLISIASADLPIHCPTLSQPGHWRFHIEQEPTHTDLFSVESLCQSSIPNKLVAIGQEQVLALRGEVNTVDVTLMDGG